MVRDTMEGGYTLTHLYFAVLGTTLFISLYCIVKWLIDTYMEPISIDGNRPGYRSAVIAEKCVSIVAGTVFGVTGLYVMMEVNDNILYGRSKILLKMACFLYFYFLQDIFTMYLTFLQSREYKPRPHGSLLSSVVLFVYQKPLMLVHHVIMVALTVPFAEGSLRCYFGDWYVGCLFFMEVSTPILSLHYILECFGWKDSFIQQINGIFFVIVFFIVRIATFPFMYLVYAHRYHHDNIIAAIQEMHWFCHASMFSFYIMQGFWYVAAVKKVLRGVSRIYRKDHEE